MIVLPSSHEVEQYSVRQEAPPFPGIPLIADDEPVCLVRVRETGVGAYWSRGDVDVHLLDAKQRGFTPGFGSGLVDGLGSQTSLATLLRERRERRHRLQSGGVQTTASGLTLLQAPQPRLVVPVRT
jgi:hypothetical protein